MTKQKQFGIFYFGLGQKIPKSRGSGFEHPKKSLMKNFENPEIPGTGIGIQKPRKNSNLKGINL